jgi:hypothetical protein
MMAITTSNSTSVKPLRIARPHSHRRSKKVLQPHSNPFLALGEIDSNSILVGGKGHLMRRSHLTRMIAPQEQLATVEFPLRYHEPGGCSLKPEMQRVEENCSTLGIAIRTMIRSII